MSDSWRIPGSSCVCCVDGKEVYRHSSGFADVESGRRMQGDELFFVYSITKVVTSLAALQLLEKGLYLLNDGLDRYLPEFHDVKVRHILPDGTEEIRPAKEWIRVRDLFSMTAGYEYTTDNEFIRARSSAPGIITTREMARALAETPLTFEPRATWNYSMCHDILGAFVEVVSGMRFADYVKKYIFDPVGMQSSCFHLPKEELEKRMASKYSFNDNTLKAERIPLSNWSVFGDEYDSGGAGIICTVDDMALLADTLARGGVTRDGKRIISKATIDLWRTNTLSDEQMKNYTWDALYGYGYGLGVRTHIDPSKSGSLSPVGEFGWSGAAGGFILIDPDNKVSMFYAHHMLNNQESFVTPRIRNLLYACLEY